MEQRQTGLEGGKSADGDGLVDGEGHPPLEGGVGEGGAHDGLEGGPVRGEVGEDGVAHGGDAAAEGQPVERVGAGAQGRMRTGARPPGRAVGPGW